MFGRTFKYSDLKKRRTWKQKYVLDFWVLYEINYNCQIKRVKAPLIGNKCSLSLIYLGVFFSLTSKHWSIVHNTYSVVFHTSPGLTSHKHFTYIYIFYILIKPFVTQKLLQ